MTDEKEFFSMKGNPMKTICFKGEFLIISLSIVVFLSTGNLYHAQAAGA
jgi:hypothetical protein